jgi:hypothetical protein
MPHKILYSENSEELQIKLSDAGLDPNEFSCVVSHMAVDWGGEYHMVSAVLYTVHRKGDTEHFGHGNTLDAAIWSLSQQIDLSK